VALFRAVSATVYDRNQQIDISVEWIRSDLQKRKVHVEVLLESLEHRDAEIRFTNARRLFYILQGEFKSNLDRCCLTVSLQRNIRRDHIPRTPAPLDF